jgi:hypothetical protein
MPFTAEQWRDRAEEARASAREMRDVEAKSVMLSIAASYEHLADMAQRARPRAGNADPGVWRVRAAVYRRMAATAHDVERERKLLKLAADFEERAERNSASENERTP